MPNSSHAIHLHVDCCSWDGLSPVTSDFNKHITLPFVPAVGLQIVDTGCPRDPLVVEEVLWVLAEGTFSVYCEEQEWDIPHDELLSLMAEAGWKLG